jgi:signal transduction histidine kinase/CheY-like chemotaxis protein
MDVFGRASARTDSFRQGLEGQVVTVALVSTIAALVAAFSFYQWRNWSADRADLVEDSARLARAVAAAAQADLSRGDPSAPSAAWLLNESEHGLGAVYRDAQGRTVRLGQADGLDVTGAAAPVARYGPRGLETHAPYVRDGSVLGEVALRVDDSEVLAVRLKNIAIALGLSLIATLGAALMARRLARRALAPLNALAAGMETVAASRDFGARLPVTRDDEVGRLTEQFNRLQGALGDYDAHLRGALAEVTASRDAAEAADAMKSRFLANMGHELRTPLNGVLGMSQALLRDDLTAGQRERVQVIQRSGSALLTLLNDVLELADLEAGRARLQPARFDLDAVMTDACEIATTLSESKGLALTVEVAPSAAGAWVGDAERLRQVLYNLVANALKFTVAGAVRVRAAAGVEGLTITVADSGIGIAPEALPRLFEKFHQGEADVTRRFGGAGVGLAVCRGLIDLMGGDILVESEPGRGSVFTVRLPLSRAISEAAPATDRGVEGMRVLVAEDNETNQQVVRTVLNALGVEPVVVADGEAAVEAWAGDRWDLVLMDIQMPVRDGVSATRDIRRLEAERGLPPTRIVALTANTLPAQVDEYLAAGMDAVTPKPIMIDQLHAALAEAQAARAEAA